MNFTERNKAIVEARKCGATYAELARAHNISRERARQICCRGLPPCVPVVCPTCARGTYLATTPREFVLSELEWERADNRYYGDWLWMPESARKELARLYMELRRNIPFIRERQLGRGDFSIKFHDRPTRRTR